MAEAALIEIGYVARAHGVAGELRVHLHDPGSRTLFGVASVYLGDDERRLLGVRPSEGALLVRIEGVADRDAAGALKGRAVRVRRADLALAEGEFLLGDLVGCAVVDAAGSSYGLVAELWHGPQDILVIRDAHVERLLPLQPFLTGVDLDARRVTVEVPEDWPSEPLAAPRRTR